MKLALYQGPPTDGDVAGALTRLQGLVRAAGIAGARMLVLPELFLPGYNRPDLHRTLAQPLAGDWITSVRDMARDAGCGVTLGWAERDGNRVYNAATAISPEGGILGHYRKIQLFGPLENAAFSRGDRGYALFDFLGRRFGLLICYDIEFPGHAAALRDRGAQVILVPTANPVGYDHVQQVLVPARAYESRTVIAYANWAGTEAGLTFGGLSLIAGPDARPLAQAAATGEALLIVDLAAADAIPAERLSTQDFDWRTP
jgi:predicted amidohydrolase